jgi:hypothetical protein
MPSEKPPQPDPNIHDEQDPDAAERNAQAEDPTSPERGFDDPDDRDAEPAE